MSENSEKYSLKFPTVQSYIFKSLVLYDLTAQNPKIQITIVFHKEKQIITSEELKEAGFLHFIF